MDDGPDGALYCNFCDRQVAGGVAGATPGLYICPDCIDLCHQIIHEQRNA